jgi:ABC-type uncharacterized transport system permease subunit
MPLLPLRLFVACYRVSFTFTIIFTFTFYLPKSYTTKVTGVEYGNKKDKAGPVWPRGFQEF